MFWSQYSSKVGWQDSRYDCGKYSNDMQMAYSNYFTSLRDQIIQERYHKFDLFACSVILHAFLLSANLYFLYPRYEVYRGYIVFAFSVIMFVCLCVCLFVCKLFFFVKDFSATTWVRILKFGTRLDSDELYCVTKEQPHIAYQSLYLFIFLSLQWKNFSSKISQQLLGLGFWNLVQSLIVMSCIV